MNTRNKKSSGFTVMELMVGMITMSIMVLVVGSMLYYGFLGWKRGNDVVNMQRDASLALRVMAKEIRMSDIANIDTSVPSELTCTTPDGTRSTTFTFAGGNLDASGSVSMRLVRDCVNNFSVSPPDTNGMVTITLNLDAGTDQNNNTLEVATRN